MVKEINSSEELNTGKPVVLDMWAPWCAPCNMIKPIIEELSETITEASFLSCNVDDNPNMARKFGIRGIPTILLIKDGKVLNKVVGAQNKQAYEGIIRNMINQK